MLGRINKRVNRLSPLELQNKALSGAQKAKDLLIADMALPKGGTFHRGNRVPSSKEGETPAIQSGQIVDNTEATRGQLKTGKGEAFLDSSGQHAILMEFGWTTKDGQLHSRPFHRTIVARYREEILAEMR